MFKIDRRGGLGGGAKNRSLGQTLTRNHEFKFRTVLSELNEVSFFHTICEKILLDL